MLDLEFSKISRAIAGPDSVAMAQRQTYTSLKLESALATLREMWLDTGTGTPGSPLILDDYISLEKLTPAIEQRKVKFAAMRFLINTCLAAPKLIEEKHLISMHKLLDDPNAAIVEDTVKCLGILARPESRPPLRALQTRISRASVRLFSENYTDWAVRRIDEPNFNSDVLGSEDPSTGSVIEARQVGPDVVQLIENGSGKFNLRNFSTGHQVAVSQREASAFLRTPSHVFDLLLDAEGGVDALAATDARLADVSLGLPSALRASRGLNTLVDTTTLRSSIFSVGSPAVFPEFVFDLSTLIYCCVMYDFVLVDAYAKNEPVPEPLRGVVIPIRGLEGSTIDRRYEIATLRAGELDRDKTLRAELEEGWQRLIGKNIHLSFSSFDKITDSPGIAPYVPGSPFGFFDPFYGGPGHVSEEVLSQNASVQTFRYFINETIAGDLGVSYNCTSLRYSVEYSAIKRRGEYRKAIDRFFEKVEDPAVCDTHAGRHEESPYLPLVRLPNPIRIVLSRAESRSQIWEEVVRLRGEFEPIREFFAENPDPRSLDTRRLNKIFLDAFSETDRGMYINGPLDAGASFAAATWDAGAAPLVLLTVGSLLKPEKMIDKIKNRLLRPELRFVRRLADEMSGILDSTDDILRLWGDLPDSGWIEVARRLTAENPRRGFGFMY